MKIEKLKLRLIKRAPRKTAFKLTVGRNRAQETEQRCFHLTVLLIFSYKVTSAADEPGWQKDLLCCSVTVSHVSQWPRIVNITALLPSISIGLFAFPISGTSTLFINI